MESWREFLQQPLQAIQFGGNAAEVYFEEEDLDVFLHKLANFPAIVYVHPMETQAWGQRTVRFYDLDQHIIEVGESLGVVIQRFAYQGMQATDIATKMGVPLNYVLRQLRKSNSQ